MILKMSQAKFKSKNPEGLIKMEKMKIFFKDFKFLEGFFVS